MGGMERARRAACASVLAATVLLGACGGPDGRYASVNDLIRDAEAAGIACSVGWFPETGARTLASCGLGLDVTEISVTSGDPAGLIKIRAGLLKLPYKVSFLVGDGWYIMGPRGEIYAAQEALGGEIVLPADALDHS